MPSTLTLTEISFIMAGHLRHHTWLSGYVWHNGIMGNYTFLWAMTILTIARILVLYLKVFLPSLWKIFLKIFLHSFTYNYIISLVITPLQISRVFATVRFCLSQISRSILPFEVSLFGSSELCV